MHQSLALRTLGTLAVRQSFRPLAGSISAVHGRGELIVAILNKDTPPFVQEKDGELVGVDIDLVKKIAEALRVSLRFDRFPIAMSS
mgnify:CR=1 FL=1